MWPLSCKEQTIQSSPSLVNDLICCSYWQPGGQEGDEGVCGGSREREREGGRVSVLLQVWTVAHSQTVRIAWKHHSQGWLSSDYVWSQQSSKVKISTIFLDIFSSIYHMDSRSLASTLVTQYLCPSVCMSALSKSKIPSSLPPCKTVYLIADIPDRYPKNLSPTKSHQHSNHLTQRYSAV